MNILPSADNEISVNTLENMPYLQACIKESIRLYPAGSGTARRTNEDLEIGGYLVPKGTDVILNTESSMRESKYFSDPEKFIPERWLNDMSEAAGQTNPFAYIPFGYGPRKCLGEQIANTMLKICVIAILRNFQIEYNDPPEEVFVSYLMNVPKAPLRFKFTDLGA